jgi:prevent-host-death family protein
MRSFTSADAKNKFGELIDLARAAPVAVTKYDRPVIVVMSVEKYKKLVERRPVRRGQLSAKEKRK